MPEDTHTDPAADSYGWTSADGGSYYAKLKAPFTTSQTAEGTTVYHSPSRLVIRRAFRTWLYTHHPVRTGQQDNPAVVRAFRCGMEAYECLKNPRLQARYDDFVLDENGRPDPGAHARFVLTEELRQPYPERLTDWVVLTLRDILETLPPAEPEDPEDWMERIDDITAELKGAMLPKVIPGQRLRDIPLLDVAPLIDELRLRYPDLNGLQGYRITVRWVRDAKKSAGLTIKGSAKPMSDTKRCDYLLGRELAPHAVIELGLDYWLAANPTNRRNTLYHELRHFKGLFPDDRDKKRITGVPHRVEGWWEEVRDIGIRNRDIAMLILEAIKRPDLKQQLAAYGLTIPEQVTLL